MDSALPRPQTLSLQPTPSALVIIHNPPWAPRETIITRHYPNGDHLRCRNCPVCSATPDGVCTIIAPGVLDPRSAGAYRFTRPTG
jgi:hypothetical protein